MWYNGGMAKDTVLREPKRCISCAYLYIARKLGREAQEVRNSERLELINKTLPTKEYNPTYKCYKGWVVKNIAEAICPSKDWEAHKEGIHPSTAQENAKERKSFRWTKTGVIIAIIGTITTLAVLGLTIYNVFFK